MRVLIAFLAIFVLCFDLSNARANGDTTTHRTPSQIVMDSVPIADRPNFVAYHISIALTERHRDDVVFKPVLETIPSEKRAEFSRISTPPNFSTNLLDWTELELVPFKNGNQGILRELLGGKAAAHGAEVMNVCFPNGCVDPNDAGYLCLSKSHFSVGETISIGLADAGHNVTLISPYDYKPKHRNIEPVQVTGVLEKAEEMMKQQESQGIEAFTKMPVTVILPILLYYGYDLCDFTLQHENVRALYGRKYDLVIVEIFGTDSMIGLGQQFDAPVIGFSTFSTSRWTNDLIGNPSPLSYVSHTMKDFPDKMNLWNRISNIVFYGYESLILNAMSHPLQRWVYNSAFPNAKLTYDEARKNVSLIFVNSHFSLARPLPYGPNTIEVGGMHVSRNPKPLPQDIQSFLDSATDGVIYFSLGSFMKSSQFPIEKRDAFINNFAKLKQKIVWKFEDDTVPMPKNVYTGSWLPQSDILGHPNVKAFISHGGLLGTTEAIYHGVPIVGIPFFGDQLLNIQRGSQAGWAVKLNYDNITMESVEWALNEILNEKRYLENAKIMSQRYRDQPMTPIETMVYWSEYVIRHKGAPHLRSAGLDLNFIQYHNLDAFAVIFAFVIVFCYAMKFICGKLCCRRSKKVEKSANKKKNN